MNVKGIHANLDGVGSTVAGPRPSFGACGPAEAVGTSRVISTSRNQAAGNAGRGSTHQASGHVCAHSGGAIVRPHHSNAVKPIITGESYVSAGGAAPPIASLMSQTGQPSDERGAVFHSIRVVDRDDPCKIVATKCYYFDIYSSVMFGHVQSLPLTFGGLLGPLGNAIRTWKQAFERWARITCICKFVHGVDFPDHCSINMRLVERYSQGPATAQQLVDCTRVVFYQGPPDGHGYEEMRRHFGAPPPLPIDPWGQQLLHGLIDGKRVHILRVTPKGQFHPDFSAGPTGLTARGREKLLNEYTHEVGHDLGVNFHKDCNYLKSNHIQEGRGFVMCPYPEAPLPKPLEYCCVIKAWRRVEEPDLRWFCPRSPCCGRASASS